MNQDIIRKDGDWYIEHRYPLYDRPVSVGVRWRVVEAFPAPGNYGPAPELSDGLIVTSITGSTSNGQHRWQAYKDGGYVIVIGLEHGERLPDVPIAPPKVRAGVEVRWYQSHWQKYLKREGWISA